MELRVINTFLRASQTESFSKAADSLGYSQAAVTLQIKQLEEELGIELFERIGKRVKLTAKGAEFAERAASILNDLEEAVSDLSNTDEITGKLSVAASESICDVWIPEIITTFINRHPKVEISITSGADSTFYDMLQHNDVDLAIISDGIQNKEIEVKTVFKKEYSLVFVAGTQNPLTRKRNVSLEKLLESPMILTERDIYSQYDLELILGRKGMDVELKPIVNAPSTMLIVNLLLKNDAISFLPEYVVSQSIRDGEVAAIKCDEIDFKQTSRMVHHKNKIITPQMKAFIEITKEIMG